MTDERIIAYLLEELPEEDAVQFEEECFARESWPSEINLIEEDLIDDYLRGELAPERRRHFEQNYLTTAARRERVRMAAALLRHVDEDSADAEATDAEAIVAMPAAGQTWAWRLRDFWSGQTWGLRAAAGALAALVIVVGLWWFSASRTPNESRTATYATLALSISNGSRAQGASVSRVKLSPDAGGLKIFLTLPDGATSSESYRVQLEDVDGEIKFSGRAEPADARSVSVAIPASQLGRGQYAVTLFALKSDGGEQRVGGNYQFNVE